ncbi:pyridoxal phosphate-dependent decarboxylase family protein, partial [Streptomyces sp. URMC 123]|uniref:pyridoxal phosphate-dependent decarboxylase family protein n=1 Tax=Streptomyces sp. URMC 123 TaxID=3423403 RepID=UPI003F1B209F
MGDLDNGWTVSDAFPEHPLAPDDVLAALAAARAETTRWDDPEETRLGFAMSAPDPLAVRAWTSFLPANTNNVGVHTGFGAGTSGTRRLEREALLCLAGLYGAPSAEGYLTSGATEAVIQGLRIGRNAVRTGPGDRVAVVTGEFAHHSVAKAGEVLGLDVVPVPADSGWVLTPEAADRAIDSAVAAGARGILLVATAGYYNSGLCDPVDALSELIRERAVRDTGRIGYFCYVDAAHGGFVYPFSAPDLPFDFRNPGVHAMAVDPHKSGLLPYSCGVLLTRRGLLAHATAVSPVTGVVDDTLIGSRPGAAAAALWSVLHGYGRSGFTALTRACLDRRDELADALRAAAPGCLVRTAPHAPVVSAAFDIPGGRLPQDFENRYRLVAINAPTAGGGRRPHYHFYAGHSLTERQLDSFRGHLGRALAAAAADSGGPGRGAGEGPAESA